DAAIAQRLLEWAKERCLRVWWGNGRKDGSFFPMYDNRFGKNFLFSVWTYGNIEIQFQHMRRPPFDQEHERRELAHRLSAIGATIPEDSLRKRQSLPLSLLLQSGSLNRFLETFDWMLSEIKKMEDNVDGPEPQPLGPI